jgi:hypothetical protein
VIGTGFTGSCKSIAEWMTLIVSSPNRSSEYF